MSTQIDLFLVILPRDKFLYDKFDALYTPDTSILYV